jgi:nucleoside phosphorylase
LACDGVSIDNAVIVSDAYEAKRQISQRKFDLLILDINIPKRADEQVTVGGGLDVLSFIRTSGRAIAPTYVIGLTAYPDGADAAQSAFAMPLWKLLVFSYSSDTWRESIKEAVNYLKSHSGPPYFNDGRTYHCDVGIVVALEGEELDGVRRLPFGWEDCRISHDPSRYLLGTVSNPMRELTVVAVASPRMGLTPAAVTATKLISSFRPRLLAMTGICAGVRGKTELGDVLVADPCFYWGGGKWVHDKATSKTRFEPAAYQWRLSESIRSAVRAAGDDAGLMKSVHETFPGKKPAVPPKVVIDAMASGAAVLQSSQSMQEVRAQHKNLVGIEMESYAVFCAAEYSSEPRPQVLSLKSVCDFGDNKKNDDFHEYAVFTSSEFLRRLLLGDLCLLGLA